MSSTPTTPERPRAARRQGRPQARGRRHPGVRRRPRRRRSTSASGGGSTPTSPSTTASASSSSRRPARAARSSSAPRSPRPRRARRQGLYLVVSDIEAARDELAGRGVEVSEVFHPGDARGAIRGRRRRRAGRRAGAGARELRLLRDVPRPRRQRLAAPGGHHAAPRPRRRRRDAVRLRDRPGRRPAPRGGRPRRARAAQRRRVRRRTGPTGTPPTWSPSRPARSCRHEHVRERIDQATVPDDRRPEASATPTAAARTSRRCC